MIFLLLGLLLAAGAADAQPSAKPAVALVLEVSGGAIAGLGPFREIPADTTVTVPPGTRLVFQHYASCRKFTLVGGVATLRSDGVEISGTQPTSTRVTCPRKVALKEDGASAAVTMRSIGGPSLEISARPEFVIVGPRAAEFAGVRVRRGNDVILEQPLGARRIVIWPEKAAALSPDTAYELELLPANAGREPIVVGLRTAAAAKADVVTIISAE